MQSASPVAIFLMQWIVFCIIQCALHEIADYYSLSDVPAETSSRTERATPCRSNVMFVESFSPHHANGRPQRLAHQHTTDPLQGILTLSARDEDLEDDNTQLLATISSDNITMSESADIDISGINEAQLLLACRAYLLRKHKLEWKAKKRRAEAAASPLNNEGYFWPDPSDLLYLREDPDPSNLIYNETYGESYGYKRNGVRFLASPYTTYSGKNYITESVQPEDQRASTSANPFSSNPLYPSDEHVRRSNAKLRLWNNSTWKEEWYKRRWKGKVATEKQKIQEKQDKLLREIPNDVLESPTFDDMSEEEVAEAIITYLHSNLKKSESRKINKEKRKIEQDSFREWRKQVKKNVTMNGNVQKMVPQSSDDSLSFSPSAETMKKLKAQRAEKSRKAFQTRLANSKANTTSSSTKKIIKLRRYNLTSSDYENENENMSVIDERVGEISPMQAILQIDMALDHNKLPSLIDVETILKPGRLGRRRDTLRRILSECFDLRGKCIPSLSGESCLLFVTKCTIGELGVFVLDELKRELGS